MTEIAELVAAPNLALSDDKCPFCDKDPNQPPHDSQEKEVNIDKIKSHPKNLGDLDIGQKEGDYGRARHHLIPAIQCFKQVRRLAKMALLVGYDINDPANGIGLPTIWNPYFVNGKKINFGKIKSEDEKDKIRYRVMKERKLQWHVGNHHYAVPENESRTEEMEDEGSLDHESYDVVVVQKLLFIMEAEFNANLCEKKKQDDIKQKLDKLSEEIRGKLNAFKVPKESHPYYVSLTALEFKYKFPNGA